MTLIKIHTTTSTNDALRLLIREDIPENFTTISADFQTKGRGMQTNKWLSESSKNLLFSTLIKHKQWSVKDGFKLNEMVSLALVDVLSLYVKPILIKWPNDILADSKKIAGILIENVIKGSHINYSIVGVGLNINQMTFKTLEKKATSLAILTQKVYEPDDILNQIIERFRFYFESTCHPHLHREYMDKLVGFQEYMFYKLNDGTLLKAKITGVEPSGYLVLEDESGKRRSFDKKEVSWLDF